MINHLYSFLCEKVITDKMTQMASYINIIPGGAVDVLPKNMPSLWIATCWLCTGPPLEEFKVRVNFRYPSGKSKLILDLLVKDPKDDPSEIRRHMVNLYIDQFKVEEEGLHFFEVDYKVKNSKNWKRFQF